MKLNKNVYVKPKAGDEPAFIIVLGGGSLLVGERQY